MELHGLGDYAMAVLEADCEAVVLCDTSHRILYLNPAAQVRYQKYGGNALVGQSLLACHNPQSNAKIERVVAWFAQSAAHNRVFTHYKASENMDVYMVALRDNAGNLIGYFEQHCHRNRETAAEYEMKDV